MKKVVNMIMYIGAVFAAVCIAAAGVFAWRDYQEQKEINEALLRKNCELRGHVETLAVQNIDLLHKLEAAHDRAEALLK